MRAPEAPIGWPRAIAPPFTLTLSASQAQLAVDADRLGGEGLVGLDQVEIRRRPAGLLEALARRWNRPGAHDAWIHPRAGERGDPPSGASSRRFASSADMTTHAAAPSFRPEALPAVTVPCLSKAGPEAARAPPRSCRHGGTRRCRRRSAALALRDLDRDDLVAKPALGDRGDGLLLRRRGECILILARDAELLGDVLGGVAHMDIVERVPEPVADHRVHEGPIAHSAALAGAHERVRRHAHVLLAAGQHGEGVAAADGLRRQPDRLQAAAAHLVDRERRHLVGQPRFDGRLPGGILAGGSREHLPHDDLVDLARLDPGLLDQRGDHPCAKPAGGDCGQRAAELPDGGAAGRDDDGVDHGEPPSGSGPASASPSAA